jgi:PLAT/LH2 domain
MKKVILIFASLLLGIVSIAQVIRDHRKNPKPTEKPATTPGTTPAEPIMHYSPQVVLYEEGKFAGQSRSFGAGTYRFTSTADFNDVASSIKVPAGFVAVIYEHANESGGYGDYIDLMEDCENLKEYDFNDKASYLTVFSTASRPGYVYFRNRKINNQFVAWRWEREGPTKPDNSLPAVSSSLPPVIPPDNSNSGTLSFENMAVYRIQLRITTGTGTDAGTDDPVYVQLNPLDEKFYLVKGIDNFQEGTTVTYDVLSEKIKKVKDIEFIRFGIRDDDGLCIKSIELFLNNNPAAFFARTYPGTKGLCFDNNSTTLMSYLEVHGSQLRESNSWKFTSPVLKIEDAPAMARPPDRISKEWISSVIEAAVGHFIGRAGDSQAQWGTTADNTKWGDVVEAKKVNDHTLHIDLDQQETGLLIIDGEVDVDFDLDFHCDNGVINCELENVQVDGEPGYITGPFQLINKTFFEKFKVLFPVVSANAWIVCTRALVTEGGDILLR